MNPDKLTALVEAICHVLDLSSELGIDLKMPAYEMNRIIMRASNTAHGVDIKRILEAFRSARSEAIQRKSSTCHPLDFLPCGSLTADRTASRSTTSRSACGTR